MVRSPSFRQRRLAKALRALREQAGINSAAELATALGWSTAKVSRVESAQTPISGDDTYELCQRLDVDQKTTDALVHLARQVKRRDWWAVYGDVLGSVTDLLELETDARRAHSFSVDLVWGMLQTEDYARAVIGHGANGEASDAVDRRVQLRMERQRRITKDRLDVWSIMDESALHRVVGSPAIMAEQLDTLTEWSEHPQVSIQVVPFAAGGHDAMGTPFKWFMLDDGAEYAYQETLSGGFYIENDAEVRDYAITWARLAGAALSFDRSAELISDVADQYRTTSEPRTRTSRVAKEQP